MAARKPSNTDVIYQLKVTLDGIRPPIWRRVLVHSNTTLGQLHWVLQISMGWTNSHLHSFRVNGVEYGELIPELGLDELEPNDERVVILQKLVTGEKFKFSYLYDFGDSWEHEILVEKVLEIDPELDYPICVKGKRACPPEDCGGIWGYGEFLDAIQDPSHPEHEETLEWVGGSFDSEDPMLNEANYQLKNMLSNT